MLLRGPHRCSCPLPVFDRSSVLPRALTPSPRSLGPGFLPAYPGALGVTSAGFESSPALSGESPGLSGRLLHPKKAAEENYKPSSWPLRS